MPIIRIDFDNEKVSEQEMRTLSAAAQKIADPDKLIADIKSALAKWKQESGFSQPINLTLIPMNWKIEIGI